MAEHAIEYDPVKASLGRVVSRQPLLRRLFYTLLGALFLRNWYIRRELNRLRPTKSKWNIFDAGSGFGQFSYKMAKTFPNATVFGLDVKEEQIEDCTWFSKSIGQTNVKFEIGDLTEYVKPDTYDLILNTDVLEHVLEDEKLWANFFNSLRSGGYLIATTTVNKEGATEYVEGDFSAIGEHVREGYTREEFQDKAKRAGFIVDRLAITYGDFWGFTAWRILQRIPIEMANKSKLFFIFVVPWILVMYPIAAFMMWMDMRTDNKTGGGWIFVGKKP
ncbi:MAG: class I SAM-dependent methyltransferase [Calditrichaeota bacterium]|nr:class I SAM-dependent methyltransferase [Calditrichota bacterium]